MITRLKEIIYNSKRMVFFGGAGVSTESGIPDFRSANGIYSQKSGTLSPEDILSSKFFWKHTEDFYNFYRDKMLYLNVKPNIIHNKLVEFEEKGLLSNIITQNIDGLHQEAGSKNVLELHGSIHRNYCKNCNKSYDALYIKESTGIPRCNCGGLIKPDVVLYGESLNSRITDEAIKSILRADTLIIAGTSLNVYPAAGYMRFFHGKHLIVINRDKTIADENAEIVIHDSLGKVFEQL